MDWSGVDPIYTDVMNGDGAGDSSSGALIPELPWGTFLGAIRTTFEGSGPQHMVLLQSDEGPDGFVGTGGKTFVAPATGELCFAINPAPHPWDFVETDSKKLMHYNFSARVLPGSALLGDANGDGCVDDLDLTALAVHWQQSTNLWEDGDFNGDGIVNDLDLTALAVNWQQGCGGGGGLAKAWAAAQANVPEPSTLALLALGGFVMIRRHRP